MGREMEFVKVRHVTVTEQVSRQIQEMISSGRFKPGDKLPTQKELEQMMGVSRPTLREAVSRLISLGIIEARQGQGYYVKEPSAEVNFPNIQDADHKVRDIFEARLFLEATLSQLAAVFASDEELKDLGEVCDRIERGEMALEDCEYGENHIHALIARYSHNELLAQFEYSILEHLTEYPDIFMSKTSDEMNRKYRASPHHLIVAAIQRRDPVAAYNESLRHIICYTDDIGIRRKYGFSLFQEKDQAGI